MKTKEKKTKLRTEVPGKIWGLAIGSLAGDRTEEAAAGQLQATAVAGGEGGEGEQHEEATLYL